MSFSGIIYHGGEQSDCEHYTSGVKLNNTWFLISDTGILKQQKLHCNSRDTSVPYILICKRRFNFLTAPPDSLNGPTGVHPASEVITETAETLIQQSVFQDLFFKKQKKK